MAQGLYLPSDTSLELGVEKHVELDNLSAKDVETKVAKLLES